jgi:hypothetical protein
MNITKFLSIVILLFLVGCESDEQKMAKAEKECAQKKNIDRLNISFFGYFPKDADTVQIKIKRGNKIIENYNDTIPHRISDSLRHIRYYDINKQIALTDTVWVKIKNEPAKKIYGFKYMVRPHFTMMNSGWGCDFYELVVDGKTNEGAFVNFHKKNQKIIDRKDFKNYYHLSDHGKRPLSR